MTLRPHTQSTTLDTPKLFYSFDFDTVQGSMVKDRQPMTDRAVYNQVDGAVHSTSNSPASSTSSTFPSSLTKLTRLTRQLSAKHSMSQISIDSGICLPSSSSSEVGTPPETPSASQHSFNTTDTFPHLTNDQIQELEVDNDEGADDSGSTRTVRPSRTETPDSDSLGQRRVNFETSPDTQIEGSDSSIEDEEEEDVEVDTSSKSSEKTLKGVLKLQASLRRKLSKLVISDKEQPVYVLYPKTELLSQDAAPPRPESPMSDAATPPPLFPYSGRLEYASRYGSDITSVDPATGRKLDFDDEARQRERLYRKAVLRSKSMSGGKSRRLPNFTPAMTEGRDTEPVEVARIRRMYSTRGHHHSNHKSHQGTQRKKSIRWASATTEEWIEQHQRYKLSDNPVGVMSNADAYPSPVIPSEVKGSVKKISLSRKSSTRKISIREPQRPRAILRKKSTFGTQYEKYRQRRTDEPRPKKTEEAIREETEILTFELTVPNTVSVPVPEISITTNADSDSLPNDDTPVPRLRRLSFLDPVVVHPRRLSCDPNIASLRRYSHDLSRRRCGGRQHNVHFSSRRPSALSIDSTRSSIAYSVYSAVSEGWDRPEFYEKSKSARYPVSLQTKIKTAEIEEEEEEQEKKDAVSKILDVNDVSVMVAQGIDPNDRHPDAEAFYRYHFDYFATHGEFRPDPIDLGANDSMSKVESRESEEDTSSECTSPTSPSASSGGVFQTLRRVTSKKLLAMKPALALKRKKSKDLANNNNSSAATSPRLEKIGLILHELSPNGDDGMDERWLERVPKDERRPGRFDVDWLDAMPL